MIPALVVPVLNRPDLLHRMIASIDHPVGDLVVIDNGRCTSTIDHWPTSRHVERTHRLAMPSNLGVPASWNLGVKATPFAPWWLIVNSDVTFPPGSLERLADIRAGGVVLSAASPPWACFALHDEAVAKVGLFDESIHPAYWEDRDYERRLRAAGVPIVETDIPVHHDNSSTLMGEAAYQRRNTDTFTANAAYFQRKVDTGDLTEGRWDIRRRRELSWD